MRVTRASLVPCLVALLLGMLFGGVIEAVTSVPPQESPAIMNVLGFQRLLMQVTSDSAAWDTWLRGITPRDAGFDAIGTKDIESRKARLASLVNQVASQAKLVAEKESLEGDNRLLNGLQSTAEGAEQLMALLAASPSKRPRTASQQPAQWANDLSEIRRQALAHAANVLAHTIDITTLARTTAQARSKGLLDLTKLLVWPFVLVAGLMAFRRPLSRFFEGLGDRITKFSVLDVEFELATLESTPFWSGTDWSDPELIRVSGLSGGAVVDQTTIMELFKLIHDDAAWTYMIVDLQNGRHWLVSRLFLFTTILQQMGYLKCVVFVQTKDDSYRRFLGTASPEQVYGALAKVYPWLPQALKRSYFVPSETLLTVALTQPNAEGIKKALADSVPLNERLTKANAEMIVNAFIRDPEIQKTGGAMNTQEWEFFSEANVWEHTKWLDIQRFNNDLRGILAAPGASWLEDGPDVSSEKRVQALLRRNVRYVALVNQRMEFMGLVDREPLLQHMAAKQGESAGMED